ncbi:TetR/AcrR family transcriptional regulator [Rapidithrix thailandica]|uniref:TetR/AcrR family transcriptional regulator n=1 Tax=Rapidithrix thailandica TaxID=413964 RepID=A0AAW9SK10_9BACT
MARLTKENWLDEGFKILSEFAQNKIRIMYLCERLGVTRGSFYHHFTSIENYIDALLKKWEQENTYSFIEKANEGEAPVEKLSILSQLVLQNNHSIEAAIRSWGFYDPIVKSYLERVDQSRLKYLEEILLALGYKKQEAWLTAKLDYAMLIGIQQMSPDISEQELSGLFEVYWQQQKKLIP